MTTPVFSIITAARNAADSIGGCLDSVAAQSFREYEHIVIDGASTDGTPDLLRARADDRVTWISERDSGIYEAWNKGVSRVRGEWLLFLGADDRLAGPRVLEDIAAAIATQRTRERIVYGHVRVVTEDFSRVVTVTNKSWAEMQRDRNPMRPAVPHPPATFLHHSLFADGNRFDTSYKVAADHRLLIAVLLQEAPLFVPVTVTVMACGGVSSFPSLAILNEERRILRELGIELPISRMVPVYLTIGAKSALLRVLGKRRYRYLSDVYRVLRGRERIWHRD